MYWKKGQIKFKINADESSIYYMRDHSEMHFPGSELIGTNYIQIGRFTLKRSFPELATSLHTPQASLLRFALNGPG